MGKSLKEQILTLHRTNRYTSTEIANICGCSVSHVDKITHSISAFPIDKYIRIVMNGYANRDELASKLNLTKPTILKFERESGIIETLAKYYHIKGYSDDYIAQALHVRLCAIKELNLDQYPSASSIQRQITQAMSIIEIVAQNSRSATIEYNNLKKASDLIKSLVMSVYLCV